MVIPWEEPSSKGDPYLEYPPEYIPPNEVSTQALTTDPRIAFLDPRRYFDNEKINEFLQKLEAGRNAKQMGLIIEGQANPLKVPYDGEPDHPHRALVGCPFF